MSSDETNPTPTPPPPGVAAIALRVAGLAGLAASAILLVDYVRVPVFCAEQGSGCDLVRHSVFARPFGVPLPIPGIAYFTLLLGLTLPLAVPSRRRALGLVGILGAAAGLTFLSIQAFILQHFCKYCVVVDTSALVGGLLAWSQRPTGPVQVAEEQPYRASTHQPEEALTPRWLHALTAVGALLAAGVPLGYGLSRPVTPLHIGPTHLLEPPPPAILREQREGVATIVEFVDFECPFCRRQHEALEPILRQYGSRVRVIRHNVPLSFHEHAAGAARAACCAAEQGKGDQIADRLFRSEDLTAEGCARAAREVGVNPQTFETCMRSQRPEAEIERDHNLAREVGVAALPTFWIGTERFEGLQDADAVRGSIERALHRPRAHDAGADAHVSGT